MGAGRLVGRNLEKAIHGRLSVGLCDRGDERLPLRKSQCIECEQSGEFILDGHNTTRYSISDASQRTHRAEMYRRQDQS